MEVKITLAGLFSSEICFRWCNFCILAKTTVFDRFGGAPVQTTKLGKVPARAGLELATERILSKSTEIGRKAGLFAKLEPGRARKRINAT